MSKSDILFLHPDLGVGGAERLVVDAALSLQENGCKVSFVTAHHDKSHCFQETKDGTLDITVVGDWLPRHVFGKFYAVCAYLRMIYCAFYVIFYRKPDIVFCDLISVCIPILHLKKFKIIFYCHFPDQLLSVKTGKLKDYYRKPLNYFEEKTTGMADKILVNSLFTKNVFKNTFTTIIKEPDVLYPSINTTFFENNLQSLDFIRPELKSQEFVFLSINRYERKKNVELSIKAFHNLKNIVKEIEWNRCRLIIIGGYDSRVEENVEYFKELNNLALKFCLVDKINFLKSPSDIEKVTLVKRCDCLIYTPANEHFGIVPLEAMFCKKPVIAVNSGGPTETVVNGITGFLCEQTSNDFAEAMSKIIINENKLRSRMGEAGHKRFLDNFSYNSFSINLKNVITEMCDK